MLHGANEVSSKPRQRSGAGQHPDSGFGRIVYFCPAIIFATLTALKIHSMPLPSLDVIIPCYNPPGDWEGPLVERFSAFQKALAGRFGQVSLIVVNDGSPRNITLRHIDTLRQMLPDVQVVSYAQNRGKGFALRQGVNLSFAQYQVVTDADFPYSVDSMVRLIEVLLQKGGIVAGNRDTVYYDRVPRSRRLLSKVLRWLLRTVLNQPVDDSQCGLKAFDAAGRAIFLETTIERFLFDLEFLMLANGRVAVTPVPVQLREGVVFSKVGIGILATEGRNFLKLLVQRRVRSMSSDKSSTGV